MAISGAEVVLKDLDRQIAGRGDLIEAGILSKVNNSKPESDWRKDL
jgi:hypothetical protein